MKWIKYILFFIVMVVFFVYHTIELKKRNIQRFKEERDKEYAGIIKKIYIDRYEHDTKTIVLNENYVNILTIWDLDRSGIYEFVKVGDSIVKRVNTYQVDVYRSDSLIKTFEIDYGLSDSDLN